MATYSKGRPMFPHNKKCLMKNGEVYQDKESELFVPILG